MNRIIYFKMEFQYQINTEHALVLAKRSGNWTAKQFIESFDSMRGALSDYQSYNLISDLREVNAAMSPGELKGLADYIAQSPLTAGITLLLVNKPVETALVMLYKNAITTRKNIQIFSTVEGASDYMGIDLSPLLNKL